MSLKSLDHVVIGIGNRLFGSDVVYTFANGDSKNIKGIFSNTYVEVEGIVSVRPTLQIRLSDLSSSPRKGDSVLVSDTSYRVLESRIDGYGGSTLILQKV